MHTEPGHRAPHLCAIFARTGGATGKQRRRSRIRCVYVCMRVHACVCVCVYVCVCIMYTHTHTQYIYRGNVRPPHSQAKAVADRSGVHYRRSSRLGGQGNPSTTRLQHACNTHAACCTRPVTRRSMRATGSDARHAALADGAGVSLDQVLAAVLPRRQTRHSFVTQGPRALVVTAASAGRAAGWPTYHSGLGALRKHSRAARQ